MAFHDQQRGSEKAPARMLAYVLALVTLALACQRDAETWLTRLDEARGLAADLRLQFSHATDASNRAVLADTDEASVAFARESEQGTKAVQRDVEALTPLLQALAFSSEAQVLREFAARFVEYQTLDRRILKLAVENTNLKAQALSLGAASQAATAFRDALGTLASSLPAKDRCRVDALAAEALLAVREIQVLHAPHIAERNDDAMTRMEKELAGLDAKASAALASLQALAAPSAPSTLTEARAALDRFKAVSDQIVQLSRRNTNVLSLDLSLREKPALAAACQERLRALQDSLAKRGSKATR